MFLLQLYSFVFGRKWHEVIVSVSAEYIISFSTPVSFLAVNAKPVFSQPLLYNTGIESELYFPRTHRDSN